MRGDAALTARLLLRGTGLAGLTVVVGGVTATVAAARPWYDAVAAVAMLGQDQSRTVASLRGVPTTPLGWAVLAVGLVAAAVGLAVAVDRPPGVARPLLLGCGVMLAALAVVGWLRTPTFEQVAGTAGAELVALGERLPEGVELRTGARPDEGPPLTALAATLVAGGAFAAREG